MPAEDRSPRACASGSAISNHGVPTAPGVVLSDTVRLTRLGRDPRQVLTIDHDLSEVVLLYVLTHAGHMVSQWTRLLDMVEPGVIRDAGGVDHVLNTASIRLYLALHRRCARGGL